MESKHLDAFHQGQYDLLERIATGAPLVEVLDSTARLIEAQAPGMLCTILTVDTESGCMRTAAAPSVPSEYAEAINGLAIGPNAGSCGRAAYIKDVVVAEDIERDHYWENYRHLALPHGLRACWSTPILSPGRETLGTFAMYYRTPRGPSIEEREWVSIATHLAAIAYTHEATRQIEAQTEQSKRMQALGTLAGGIAHDFSNILSAIRGHVDLALMEPMTNVAVHESLQEISRASRRAADLVRRILTFSRHDAPRRELVVLADLVHEASRLLRAGLPPNVDIRVTVEGQPVSVLADPTQLHQIIMNLGANAGYAMRQAGGVIEVVVDSVEQMAGEVRVFPELGPGTYARVRVRDHGTGMDDATQARVYEPFFTTKPAGEGTGLGMSMVYGIVKNHGGNIRINSRVGEGTSITVCLPSASLLNLPSKTPPRGIARAVNRHIMYVDDDEVLVNLAGRVLKRHGYRVTGHSDPERALEDFRTRPHEFDAVVTDMSMPATSGADFAARIRDIRANIPIVLVSGFISSEVAEHARRLGFDDIMSKPQTIHEFADMLRDRLDTPRAIEMRQLLT